MYTNDMFEKSFNRCRARVQTKEGDFKLRDINFVDLNHNHEPTASIQNENQFHI